MYFHIFKNAIIIISLNSLKFAKYHVLQSVIVFFNFFFFRMKSVVTRLSAHLIFSSWDLTFTRNVVEIYNVRFDLWFNYKWRYTIFGLSRFLHLLWGYIYVGYRLFQFLLSWGVYWNHVFFSTLKTGGKFLDDMTFTSLEQWIWCWAVKIGFPHLNTFFILFVNVLVLNNRHKKVRKFVLKNFFYKITRQFCKY